MQVSWSLLNRFDIVFMGRPASKWQMDFIRMAKNYGVKVWVDWDDHYLNIPDTNNRKHIYGPYQTDTIKWIARNADVVTVSSLTLLEEWKQLNPNTVMVRNAMDDQLFDMSDSDKYPREKLILWRGSDTHQADFEEHKEAIIELMNETPDYVWGFFGFCPDWAIDVLPTKRIRQYANDGVIEYIKTLASLRPELIYVPLEDIPFNHAKSHIAWLEGTYAGAKIVCPDWEEWGYLSAFKYSGKENFKKFFLAALSSNDPSIVATAKNEVIQVHSLCKANAERMRIAKTLFIDSFPRVRVDDTVELPRQFTDEEFFNYNKEHGWTQENEAWVKGQEELAKYCIEKLGAQSAFDLGCGTGGLLEAFMTKGIPAMGVDSNPLNKEFFDNRHANESDRDRFILEWAQVVEPANKFDVCVCIEVMEHIPDEIDRKILEIWHEKCNYFLFSSTPYHTTPQFDTQWGHINVKPIDHWVKFFEESGFKLIQRLDYPSDWTLLFVPFPKIK